MRSQEQKYESKIDENQTRMDAAIIAVLLVVFLLTGFSQILLILLYDYVVRLYVTPWLSPVYLLSTSMTHVLHLESDVGDAAPKQFAANIALLVVMFALAADFGEYETVALGLVLFLAAWKILEAAKNFCFGCRLFALLKRYDIEIVALDDGSHY